MSKELKTLEAKLKRKIISVLVMGAVDIIILVLLWINDDVSLVVQLALTWLLIRFEFNQ